MLTRIETFLRVTPWPRSVVRWLPGNSSNFGPPRRWGLIRDIVPSAGGRIIEVDSSRTLENPRAILHGDIPVTGLESFQPEAPATCVFILESARAIGQEGFIVTKDDTLLYDASFWHGVYPAPHAGHPIYLRKKARPLRRLPGTCLSLATDFASGSYGHMIHDGLTRLRLLTQAGFPASKADWILFPRLSTPNTDAICNLLGIAPDRVLNCSPANDWEFERLVGTSYPAAIGTVPPENARFLRDLGRSWLREGQPRTRVYLSRRGYQRNPVNLDECEAILREFGFLIVDPSDGESVLTACANAEIIAGIDGSNMGSLAFAPSGARVLIINPPVVPPQPYETTMAFFGDRELHLLASDPLAGITPSYSGNFYLPASRLRACLEKMCSFA